MKNLLLFLLPYLLWGEEMATTTPYKPIAAGLEYTLLQINKDVKVASLEEALREQIAGMDKIYFDQSFVQKVKEAAQKNASGEYVEYWEEGQIKARVPYRNGFLQGHVHGWYPNGIDAFKGFYKEGVRLGTHITFQFHSDPSATNHYLRVLRYDEEGLLHGEQSTYYLTGSLEMLLRYKHGVLDGKCSFYEDPYISRAVRKRKNTRLFAEDRVYEKGILKSTDYPRR